MHFNLNVCSRTRRRVVALVIKRSMMILWYFRGNESGKYIEKKRRENVNANIKKRKRTENNKERVYGNLSNRWSTMVTTAFKLKLQQSLLDALSKQGFSIRYHMTVTLIVKVKHQTHNDGRANR